MFLDPRPHPLIKGVDLHPINQGAMGCQTQRPKNPTQTPNIPRNTHSLRIYPYPMVWPLPRPWSETMVSIPLWAQKTLEIQGFLGLQRPFLDLVLQTPRPRGRGRPMFAETLRLTLSTSLRDFFAFFHVTRVRDATEIAQKKEVQINLFGRFSWAHAEGVVRQHSVLRRVLRRFWDGYRFCN